MTLFSLIKKKTHIRHKRYSLDESHRLRGRLMQSIKISLRTTINFLIMKIIKILYFIDLKIMVSYYKDTRNLVLV